MMILYSIIALFLQKVICPICCYVVYLNNNNEHVLCNVFLNEWEGRGGNRLILQLSDMCGPVNIYNYIFIPSFLFLFW